MTAGLFSHNEPRRISRPETSGRTISASLLLRVSCT